MEKEQYVCGLFGGKDGSVRSLDVFGTREEAREHMRMSSESALKDMLLDDKDEGYEGYPKIRKAVNRAVLFDRQACVTEDWRVYSVSGEVPLLDNAVVVLRYEDCRIPEVLGIFGTREDADRLAEWTLKKDRAMAERIADKDQTVTFTKAKIMRGCERTAIATWPPYEGEKSERDEPLHYVWIDVVMVPLPTVLKNITAVDMEYYGIDSCATMTLTCKCPDKDFNLTDAVFAAAEDFMATGDGVEFYKANCVFDLRDFVSEIPEDICRKHGFCPVRVYAEANMDWNENLAEPDGDIKEA